MKKFVAPALFAVLALTGCSAAATPAPAAPPLAKPTEKQRTALMAELARVNPQLAYAERTCGRWYILSAKHGLVHPDTVLEPPGIPTLPQNDAHVLEIVASEP